MRLYLLEQQKYCVGTRNIVNGETYEFCLIEVRLSLPDPVADSDSPNKKYHISCKKTE
jgi:hypothetical protein